MTRLFVLILILIAAVFSIIELSSVTICDGGYDLEVRLSSSSQTPIRAVHYGTASSMQSLQEAFPIQGRKADEVIADIDPSELKRWGEIEWEVIEPFKGQPFAAFVRTTDRISVVLGRELTYHQASRALVVLAEYGNGKRICKIAEIPDGRVSRSLSVALP